MYVSGIVAKQRTSKADFPEFISEELIPGSSKFIPCQAFPGFLFIHASAYLSENAYAQVGASLNLISLF